MLLTLPIIILQILAILPPEGADAHASRPAGCAQFKTAVHSQPVEHVPYPSIGSPWPVDIGTAEIVKDLSVAKPLSDYFPRLSLEEVREKLTLYVVVALEEWEHGYSHVGLSDEGGWISTEKECFQWTIRPGGLAWIVYPDGSAVHLAACRSDLRPAH